MAGSGNGFVGFGAHGVANSTENDPAGGLLRVVDDDFVRSAFVAVVDADDDPDGDSAAGVREAKRRLKRRGRAVGARFEQDGVVQRRVGTDGGEDLIVFELRLGGFGVVAHGLIRCDKCDADLHRIGRVAGLRRDSRDGIYKRLVARDFEAYSRPIANQDGADEFHRLIAARTGDGERLAGVAVLHIALGEQVEHRAKLRERDSLRQLGRAGLEDDGKGDSRRGGRCV